MAVGKSAFARVAATAWIVVLLAVAVYPLIVGIAAPPVAAAQDAPAAPRPPDTSARAVLTRDVSAGVDLFALNADEPMPPASTTKIATALVVMRHAELDEPVVVVPQDLVLPPYSMMGVTGLIVGDTLTVEQLLWGALLPSGNDAAKALARHVGTRLDGGEPTPERAVARFVEEMNRYAAELGLTNTHFENPDGIDSDGHLMSARDLLTLADELLQNATLREMVGTQETDVVSIGPEQRLYHLVNTNDLLGEDGVIGVKTGSEERAGGCLVIAELQARNRVVTVILGAAMPVYDEVTGEKLDDQRFEDMGEIRAALDDAYVWITPTDPGVVPGLDEALAAWSVTLETGPSLVVPTDVATQLTFKLRLGPPGEPESAVGTVLFFAGSTLLGERTLLQAAD
jgi:serine-type D-Ala-D-Ala carboxypeptidase (penicillin-binding protein 5/6)